MGQGVRGASVPREAGRFGESGECGIQREILIYGEPRQRRGTGSQRAQRSKVELGDLKNLQVLCLHDTPSAPDAPPEVHRERNKYR